MSDANGVSEVRRAASLARWGNTKVTAAADVVIDRADELDDAAAEDVMMAVARGPFAAMIPQRSQRLIAAEDRAERQEARRAERERAEKADAAHDRAVASWRAQAEARGQVVSVQDMLTGAGVPTAADVLTRVRDESEARDAVADQFRPGGNRPDEVTFTDLMPDPPVAARSETGREIANRARHFADRIAARRKAEELGVADMGLPRRESRRSQDSSRGQGWSPGLTAQEQVIREIYIRSGGQVL